jgi:hypothetical protein
MIRYINRKNGNTGYHSIPIGVAENASEDHPNLQKSISSQTEKKFVTDLLSRRLHLLELQSTNEDGKKCSRAVLMKLVHPELDCLDGVNI